MKSFKRFSRLLLLINGILFLVPLFDIWLNSFVRRIFKDQTMIHSFWNPWVASFQTSIGIMLLFAYKFIDNKIKINICHIFTSIAIFILNEDNERRRYVYPNLHDLKMWWIYSILTTICISMMDSIKEIIFKIFE
jgi:hypothetical protein